jgi:hypothetical protein
MIPNFWIIPESNMSTGAFAAVLQETASVDRMLRVFLGCSLKDKYFLREVFDFKCFSYLLDL